MVYTLQRFWSSLGVFFFFFNVLIQPRPHYKEKCSCFSFQCSTCYIFPLPFRWGNPLIHLQEENVWKGKQRQLIILFLEKLIMCLSNCTYSSGLGDIFFSDSSKDSKILSMGHTKYGAAHIISFNTEWFIETQRSIIKILDFFSFSSYSSL